MGNVYYYFKTKADLATAVADVFCEETETMLTEINTQVSDPLLRITELLTRLAASNSSRLKRGCPIYAAVQQFRTTAPKASDRATEAFTALIGWIARERQQMGSTAETALADGQKAISDWQGAIALAHALKQPGILEDTFASIRNDLTS